MERTENFAISSERICNPLPNFSATCALFFGAEPGTRTQNKRFLRPSRLPIAPVPRVVIYFSYSTPITRASSWCAQRDSNSHRRFRRPGSYPLNDGRILNRIHFFSKLQFEFIEFCCMYPKTNWTLMVGLEPTREPRGDSRSRM